MCSCVSERKRGLLTQEIIRDVKSVVVNRLVERQHNWKTAISSCCACQDAMHVLQALHCHTTGDHLAAVPLLCFFTHVVYSCRLLKNSDGSAAGCCYKKHVGLHPWPACFSQSHKGLHDAHFVLCLSSGSRRSCCLTVMWCLRETLPSCSPHKATGNLATTSGGTYMGKACSRTKHLVMWVSTGCEAATWKECSVFDGPWLIAEIDRV